MHCGLRRMRRRKQRGGIIPLILIAGKAIASAAISSAAKYGAKKALEKRKKKVGKISATQWQANLKRLNRLYRRTGRKPPLASLRMLQ